MKIEFDLVSFKVPSAVGIKKPPTSRQEGINFENSLIPIENITVEALSEMCDQFRAEVFEKAGKKDPREKHA